MKLTINAVHVQILHRLSELNLVSLEETCMTSNELLARAKLPTLDLFARAESLQLLIEEFVREVLDIPEQLNFPAALILARMAANPEVPVRAGDLIRRGYYLGSNASYNINNLIKLGYLSSSEGVDKRTRYLELTTKGKQIGGDIAQQLKFVEQQIGELFTSDDYRSCRDLLAKTVHGDGRPTPSLKKVVEPA